MRKHILGMAAPTPEVVAELAMESLVASVLESKQVLSLEEEVVVLAEADELQSEITAGVEEATRVEDISDNLLNIADIGETIGEVSPQQAALIETAAEMAVAGTDTDPEELMGAIEPGTSGTIAVEDFRQTAKNIWENIRKYVAAMIAKVQEFFRNLFSVLPRQLARIKALREAIAEKKKAAGGAKPKSDKVQLVVGSTAISYPGHMVTKSSDLVKGVNDLKKLGDYVFGAYATSVKKQGDIIADVLKSFDPHKAQDALHIARTKLTNANFDDAPKSPATGYLGNFKLKVNRVDPKKAAQLSDAMVVSALRHTGVSLDTTVASGQSGTADIAHRQFDTMSFSEMESVLSALESGVKAIIGYEGGSIGKAMATTQQNLLAAGAHAQESAAKVTVTDSTKTEVAHATDVMKSLMNFNTTFVRWSSGLSGDYIKRFLSTTRVSLIMVDKSLAQY